jgi:hypothetical protein
MAKQMASEKIVVGEFTMVFPSLFEPRKFKNRAGQETGEAKYGLTMLFPMGSPAIQQIKEALLRVAQAQWPDRKAADLVFPLKSGDKEADRILAKNASRTEEQVKFYRGHAVMKASSKYAPGVVGPNKQPLLDPKAVYSGCKGYAELNVVAYEATKDGDKDGVTCYVNFVMKSGDGPRIAGRDASSVFAGIQGGTSDEDPTVGMGV